MIEAVFKSLGQMLTPPFRAVLFKSIGLSLLLIVLIGVGLHRLLSILAAQGAGWAENAAGTAPHAMWEALVWVISIMSGLGIITGALFLMPAVTAFVGSFFVDEIAEQVEHTDYPAEPAGHALPVARAMVEGLKTAVLAVGVYLFALPFVLFAGLGFLILFFANAYLLGREYFELAAMRFRPPREAKAIRLKHRGYVWLAGMPIAIFVSIPIVSLATPLFAMAYMVHIHKQLSGPRPELIEPRRAVRDHNRRA
jgi:CysZ protein